MLHICWGKRGSRRTNEFLQVPLAFQLGILSSLSISRGMGEGTHACIPGCGEKHRIKKDGLGNGEVWEEAMAESHVGR